LCLSNRKNKNFKKLNPNKIFPFQVLLRGFSSLIFGSALATGIAFPVYAAEKIIFRYGLFARDLEIDSIEKFAVDGTVANDLKNCLAWLGVPEKDWEIYREYLSFSVDIDPVLLNRFLNSSFGDGILTEVGNVVQTSSGLNGKSSLRAAITLASFESNELTPLSVLQQLPTDLLIDFGDVESLYQAIQQIIDGTSNAIASIQQLSIEETSTQSIDIPYDELPDLRLSGRRGVEQSRIDLSRVDISEQERKFYVDLYQPRYWRWGKTPVVVLSHGLGESPEVYRQEAEHLASYGFFVAVPQHPGSDSLHQSAFRRGTASEIYRIHEFIDRPKDVTYLLDALESRNADEYKGRLDLENVGVGGHSFGGYTALALAGATIDFENLAEVCSHKFKDLNISLLLQCDALELPRQEDYRLRDSRITSVMAKNPITSGVFGANGLAEVNIPVMLLAGSHDPVTPAIYEQFRALRWLTAEAQDTEPRYLVVMEGQAHIDISALNLGVTRTLNLFKSLSLAPSEQLDQYSKALSVAFFEAHTARRIDHRLYLRSAYADYISQEQAFKVYLVSEGSSESFGNP
jgi:predicted dienelactone hydrolase